MTYHHRTVRCPNCKKVVERTTTHNEELLYGSPFRNCSYCGTTYFDSDYHEKAITWFNDKGGEISLAFIFWLLISNGIAIAVIIGALKLSDLGSNGKWFLVPLVFGMALFCDYGLIRMISNRINADKYHQKQIEIIEGRAGNRDSELEASMNRLSDKSYLDALKIKGVDVPDYFYTRLGIEPTDITPYRQAQQEKRFVCQSCGAYSTGWYQTCPKCGAVGKMTNAEEKTKQAAKKKPQPVRIETPPDSQPKKEKRFICRSCGTYSTGWYQTCPKCGISGKMESIYITVPPESSQAAEPTLANKQQEPLTKPSTTTRQSSNSSSQQEKVSPIVVNSSASTQIDPTLPNQLRQLKQLLDEGLITEDEFTAKKKQLLGL